MSKPKHIKEVVIIIQCVWYKRQCQTELIKVNNKIKILGLDRRRIGFHRDPNNICSAFIRECTENVTGPKM